MKIEQGDFAEAQSLIDKLSEIGEDYDYETARGAKYLLKIKLFLKTRKLYDAKRVAQEAILFGRWIPPLQSPHDALWFPKHDLCV